MIFPTVVEKGYAALDCFVDDASGFSLVCGVAQVMTTQSQRRDLNVLRSESSS